MARNPFKLEDHYDESFALEDDDEEEEEQDDDESLVQDNPTPNPIQRPASARHGGRGRPVSGRFRPAQPQKPSAYDDSENESSELESTDDEFNVQNYKNDRPKVPEPSNNNLQHNNPPRNSLQNNLNNMHSPFPSDESDDNFNANPRNQNSSQQFHSNQHSNQNLNPSSDENSSDNDSGTNNSSSDSSVNLYNPDSFKNLPVTNEIKELFTHINKYKPKKTPLLQKLRPFIPEYVPAVGDIDAFLKIPRPDGNDESFALGWQVLDEPSLKQTDPAVLDQLLKTLGNQDNSSQMNFVHSVEDAEKNSKRVEAWIEKITELNRSKPAQTVTFSKPMPDVESIMSAWPEKTERVLRTSNIIPSAEELDCSLEQYAKMVCTLFDIPVYEDTDSKKSDNQLIQSLHVLFSTYSQFKQLDFNQDEGQDINQINSSLLASTSNLGSTSNSQRHQSGNRNNRNVPKSSDVMTFN